MASVKTGWIVWMLHVLFVLFSRAVRTDVRHDKHGSVHRPICYSYRPKHRMSTTCKPGLFCFVFFFKQHRPRHQHRFQDLPALQFCSLCWTAKRKDGVENPCLAQHRKWLVNPTRSLCTKETCHRRTYCPPLCVLQQQWQARNAGGCVTAALVCPGNQVERNSLTVTATRRLPTATSLVTAPVGPVWPAHRYGGRWCGGGPTSQTETNT